MVAVCLRPGQSSHSCLCKELLTLTSGFRRDILHGRKIGSHPAGTVGLVDGFATGPCAA